jgi:hypothetical protein
MAAHASDPDQKKPRRAPASPEDRALVADVLRGRPTAWNAFVEGHSEQVWRRSWQLCHETCPHKRNPSIACVFHSLAKDTVAPAADTRESCDEGLDIYAFTFDYLYNRGQNTGKLKNFDGRSSLEGFVRAVLYGHLRTDWIRHKRKLRVDQITLPEEIQRLPQAEQRVFEQMVMQRPTEAIARHLEMDVQAVERAQERVTHALMANGHLHLVLRSAETALDLDLPHEAPDQAPRVVQMQRSVGLLWEKLCGLIHELPESHKILLDMMFDEELDAKTILARVERFGVELPVTPRSGKRTIHTVYQSVDAILKDLAARLSDRYPEVLRTARDSAARGDEDAAPVAVKGLKALLKQMGLRRPDETASGERPAPLAI